MRKIKNLYFTERFFYSLLAIVVLFIMAFIFPVLFIPVQIILALFILVTLADIFLLFNRKSGIKISRNYPEKLSNGDGNDCQITLLSHYPHRLDVKVLEELPVQFQYRDFCGNIRLWPQKPTVLSFQLRPTERGEYHFGHCNVLAKYLGFVQRRFILRSPLMLPCYPSFIQLKKYSLLATTNRLDEAGVKKIRRIGNTLEFERIREYNRGDDFRFINWKATAKIKKIMVNQYEDEKSQPIYAIIDLGRAMRMPFKGLTLLDYAINAALVLSNVAIIKQDRAGLLTFSKTIGQHIQPSRRSHQMRLISESLYHIKTKFTESEFGRLYTCAQHHINQRALLFLYTNFETMDALYRQLPYLKLLNKSHIVVVVIFKNTELGRLANTRAHKTREIYNQIIAERLVYDKQLIAQKLNASGLQTILTEPENLTVNSINKYLELKARGMI
ncbi:MAG TPA: DUF58 domain-containing protein [Edaphocola sp.]|nr:DUF58 domain-containing protein [Edaphocola sp.]